MTTDQPVQFTQPVTAFTITEGDASARTIMRSIPVHWVLDPATGYVTSNGEHGGRVIESIPGSVYYFESAHDAAESYHWDAFFPTAHRAAELGSIRVELYRADAP